jgi:hypothetical protein
MVGTPDLLASCKSARARDNHQTTVTSDPDYTDL